MSDIVISVAHNDLRLAGTLNHLNLGSGVARVRIYGNTRPANPATAPGADPLVEMELEDPAGSVSAGVLTLDPGADGLILTSGTATWARVVNGNGDASFDCDVSNTAGTATVRLPSTTLFAGGTTRIISAALG